MKSTKPIRIKKKNKGKLHDMLGVPDNKPIPEKKILRAMEFGTPLEKKRAVFAKNAKSWNKK
jgi:hypothetical protein